jgi:hypothetical protein
MVYKYRSTTPNWLYYEPSLDPELLPAIQKELLKLFVHTKSRTLVPYTSTAVEISDKEYMRNTCTTLMQEFRRLGIYDSFFVITFISVESTREFPPHVDVGVDIALNIPLINCEGTYTVWYDGKIIDQSLPEYAIGTSIVEIARVADAQTTIEIGRCDSNIPHWINVNILHRPETHRHQLRVTASIRFRPEPVDQHGELWPHLIKQ